MTMKKEIAGDLLKRATLFTLSLHAWRNVRKADLALVDTKGADKERLRLTKTLIECKEYDDIRRYLNGVKTWCMMRSMPSFLRDGIYVVLLKNVETFEEYLTDANEKLQDELVPKFLSAYDKAVAESKERLGHLFDPNDYPDASEVCLTFGIAWQWISFGVPDNLPEGVREKAVEKVQKAYEEAQKEIIAALRAGFGELVSRAVERLTVEPGQKPKAFKDSLVRNFDEFFATFESRNLMNDKELAELVARSKEILADVDAETLRRRMNVRKNVAQAFAKVKAEVDKLIVERPSRKFRLDEEE